MSTEPETQVARDRLRHLLQRAELAGQHQRAARARQLGLHQVELAALEHLVVAGGLTPGDLSHRLGLTSGGVTALTGRLIDAGYVERSPHPSDRRMRILTPTEAGTAHVCEVTGPVTDAVDRALSWLSAADVDVLERFLEMLCGLKERAAAATPGPASEGAGDRYTPALLM